MQFELDLNHVKGLSLIIPKNDIRYYLKGLHFEAHKNDGFYLCATDGHRLALIKNDNQQANDAYSFIIPLETITQLIKMMDKNNPIALLSYDKTENRIVIEYGGNMIRVAPIDGKFPDFRRIVPFAVSGDPGQYNSDYLADFKKMANTINATKNLDCYVKQNGDFVAVVDICAHKPEFNLYGMGLIMPLRKPDSVYADYARPLWIDPKKPDLKAVA